MQRSKSEISYTRLTNMPERGLVDDANMHHSVDGDLKVKEIQDPQMTQVLMLQLHQHDIVKKF